VAAVAGISVTVVVGLATSMKWLNMWYPIPSCLVMSAIVAASGFARLMSLREGTTEAD
jgi:hypothetical protein